MLSISQEQRKIVFINADGFVDRQDIAAVQDRLEAWLLAQKRVVALLNWSDQAEMDWKAIVEHLRFLIHRLSDDGLLLRLGVLTESAHVRRIIELEDFLLPSLLVKVFSPSEYEAARDWLLRTDGE